MTNPGEPDAGARSPRPTAPVLVANHIGLVVSVAAFAIIALRVLGVADFDVLTAVAIVQSGGAVNVALGSALASAPVVAALVLALVTGRMARALRSVDDEEDGFWRQAPYLWVALLCALLTIWWLVLLNALILVWAWLHGAKLRRRQQPADSEDPAKALVVSRPERNAWLFAAVVPQLLLTATQAWVPTEIIRVENREPFAAYVLGNSDDVTTLLPVEDESGVERLATNSITRREICRPNASLWNATALGLVERPPYPPCPD